MIVLPPKFQVGETLMTLFYRSHIGSALTFCTVCWFGKLSIKARTSLAKTVKVSSKMLGVKLHSLTELYNRQPVRKAKAILSGDVHPLPSGLQLLSSGSHFRVPAVKSNRYWHSSIPSAINCDQVGDRSVLCGCGCGYCCCFC